MLTTGELLKEERLKQGLTIEDVWRITRIRIKNLKAVEKGNWDPFPSKTYIVGVIRSYARFLKLDDEKLVAFFRREYEKKEDVHFKKRVKKSQLTPRAKRIFKTAVLLVVLAFSLYFGYQLKLYFSPPEVEILKPTKATFKKEDKIELVGRTEAESVVTVNGEPVVLDARNTFRTYIPLTRNKNQVTIEVVGANGRKTVVKKEFLKETAKTQ